MLRNPRFSFCARTMFGYLRFLAFAACIWVTCAGRADAQTYYAVWRPSSGEWYVITSANSTFTANLGVSGDIPVAGDFDGDGISDYAVWRPSNGTWYVIPSSNPAIPIVKQFGGSGDIPVPGDYDGDGITDIAVFRPSNGTWYVAQSSSGFTSSKQWGGVGDVPVVGDFDGDNVTDYAVWRPSVGTRCWRYSRERRLRRRRANGFRCVATLERNLVR